MLDRIGADMIFSPVPLPGCQHRLDGIPRKGMGNSEEPKTVSWLCLRAPIHMQGLGRSNAPLSRRNFVRSMGLLAVAALPTRMTGAPSTQDIVVVDGWILADSDLR